MGTVIPITEEKNWRSEYRYAVYEHKLVTSDGLAYSRSFIVIKNKYGVIVRFTRLHNFTGAYDGKVFRPLAWKKAGKMRADQKTVDFYKMVFLEAEKRGSLYSGNSADMGKLAEFMDMNDWFGLRGKIREKSRAASAGRDPLMVGDRIAGQLVSRLQLWLDAYGRGNCEKLELLARHGSKIFPETTSGYVSYIREAGMENEVSAWQLLDYLLAELPKELSDMSQEETERLLDDMDKELPLVTVKLFARFYEDMQARSGRNGWVYRFHSRNGKMETGAYSLRDFSRMAYCVFNEECWRKNFMLEKACSSRHDANLWIFIAVAAHLF